MPVNLAVRRGEHHACTCLAARAPPPVPCAARGCLRALPAPPAFRQQPPAEAHRGGWRGVLRTHHAEEGSSAGGGMHTARGAAAAGSRVRGRPRECRAQQQPPAAPRLPRARRRA